METPSHPDDRRAAAAGRPRVLLVQQDSGMAQLLLEELARRDGPQILEARTATGALAHMRTAPFAALVADADLPDLETSGLLPAWREAAPRSPVLLLRSAKAKTMVGEAYAVLTKPIRLASLVSWLLAVLPAGQAEEIRLGRFRLDRGQRALVEENGGLTIRLTEKEVAVLVHLAQAGGAIVSRDTLLDKVWGYAAGANTNTVATHVYRLRRKLEQDEGLARALTTEPGGYRLAPGGR